MEDASDSGAALLSGANSSQDNNLLYYITASLNLDIWDNDTLSQFNVSQEVLEKTWQMYTFVRTNQATDVYIDGEYFDSYEYSHSALSISSGGLWIGPEQDSVGGGWDASQTLYGSVDDVRLYDRTLSAEDVAFLYRIDSTNHFVSSAQDLEMIWVEPGSFTMGQDDVSGASPEHNVTLTQGFYLGKYEVTQAQYEAVMTGITGDLNATPSSWDHFPNRPVEMVSHDDIQIFLGRLNDQEAENIPTGWEYALPTESSVGVCLPCRDDHGLLVGKYNQCK